MKTDHSNPGYWTKLKGHENDLASFLAAFENLNEIDWRGLVEDLLKESPRAFDVFRPSHGQGLLEMAATYARQLSFRMQERWAGSIEAFIVENRNEDNYEGLLSRALYFATVLREAFSAATLMDLLRNGDLSEIIRLKAARALANQGETVPISYWADIDLPSFPALASALVSALATRQPALVLDKLRQLPYAPADIGSLEYPLRFTLRTLLNRPHGEEDLGRFILDAPRWLADFLREILDFAEFQTYRDAILRGLDRNPTSLDDTNAAIHLLEEYCSGRLQISPWEMNAALAQNLGYPWKQGWSAQQPIFDDACRRLVEQWETRILEDDLFSRRLLAIAQRHLHPEAVTKLAHLRDILREDNEFDSRFSDLMSSVEKQSEEQECEDAEYQEALS